mgnify:CR=1 FL=1
MKAAKKPLSPEKALERVQLLCSRTEQCTADIVRKLTGWGIGHDNVEKIVASLQRDRFLDDARFARAYCYDKFNFSGWGRRKIAQGLWAKRVSREFTMSALDEIDEREYRKMACLVIKSRVPLIADALITREGRNKLLRFAVGRGYEIKLAIDIIRSLAAGADNEDNDEGMD